MLTYETSYSNVLADAQRLIGCDPDWDPSARERNLELAIRCFREACDELHDNSFWTTSDVVTTFELGCGETVGGGYMFDECNKTKPAFDVNLTLNKDFRVVKLIECDKETIFTQCLSIVGELCDPYFMLVRADTCTEIALELTCTKRKFTIHINAGLVTCPITNQNIPVGLDVLHRQFLVYNTAQRLAPFLAVKFTDDQKEEMRKIRTKLMVKTPVSIQDPTTKMWIEDNGRARHSLVGKY